MRRRTSICTVTATAGMGARSTAGGNTACGRPHQTAWSDAVLIRSLYPERFLRKSADAIGSSQAPSAEHGRVAGTARSGFRTRCARCHGAVSLPRPVLRGWYCVECAAHDAVWSALGNHG